jgi:hypothetical protein
MRFTRVRAYSRSERSCRGQAILGQPGQPGSAGMPRSPRRPFVWSLLGRRRPRQSHSRLPAAPRRTSPLHLVLDQPASAAAHLLVHRSSSARDRIADARDAVERGRPTRARETVAARRKERRAGRRPRATSECRVAWKAEARRVSAWWRGVRFREPRRRGACIVVKRRLEAGMPRTTWLLASAVLLPLLVPPSAVS